MFVGEGSEIMIKERNFGKCDSVSSASSRRALEHIVPGGHREVQQWDRVRVNRFFSGLTEIWCSPHQNGQIRHRYEH